jgi:hypothetical protein
MLVAHSGFFRDVFALPRQPEEVFALNSGPASDFFEPLLWAIYRMYVNAFQTRSNNEF